MSTEQILENAGNRIGFVNGHMAIASVRRNLTKSQVAMWKRLLKEAIEELEKL